MAPQVILVNGSRRKSTTDRYLRQIAVILEAEGVSSTTISLADYQIAQCEQCVRKASWCVVPDDSRGILSQILNADGLVLGSAVYVGTVTGKLKSLLDKTASRLHRPPAVGLPLLPVVTTAGSGLKRTIAYLSKAVMYWGVHPVSGILRSATESRPVQRSEAEAFLHCLHAPRVRYRPSLRQVML